jgi:Amt family ammonium transporter
MALGAIAALPSYFGLLWRVRTRLDDSLDVVAAHGLGGTAGALLTGVLAEKAWGSPADGLLFGNPWQLGVQVVAILVVASYSAIASWALLKLVNAMAPLRVSKRDEGLGLDVSQHGEEAYTRGEGALLILRDTAKNATIPSDTATVGVGALGGRS